MCRYCQIVPSSALKRLAADRTLSREQRRSFRNTAQLDAKLRRFRVSATEVTRLSTALAPTMGLAAGTLAPAPKVTVYDCRNDTTLPGLPVADPGSSQDGTVRRISDETASVAEFYAKVFGRNSINDAGMTLMSSAHYGREYNNAFWNGTQMTYGDGDGRIFVDFSKGNDVIAHELTHGVTQYTLQLKYADQPGGLNESLSDCFGSMFRQWQAKQTVDQADWLIGKDIMGPDAVAKGLTCLRDMADPAARHCLAPQITTFRQYKDKMDPHTSSGVPNRAFCTIAKSVGGRSWEKVGQVWYKAMTGAGPKPNMTMKDFADLTRRVAGQLYPGDAALAKSVDGGWKQVGL